VLDKNRQDWRPASFWEVKLSLSDRYHGYPVVASQISGISFLLLFLDFEAKYFSNFLGSGA